MTSVRRFGLIGLLLPALGGCPRNIPQDSHSGKDFKTKGARSIKLEDGEGRARDIVTYPGGDRVDWKEFDVPGPGSLDIRLKFDPPRPGLDVAMNVFTGYFKRVGMAKPGGGHMKKVAVDPVEPGKYYLQVYAPGRGDAGAYTVTVKFKPKKAGQPPGPNGGQAAMNDSVPDPPTLPAIPEAVVALPPPPPPPPPPPDGNTLPPPPPPPPPAVALKARMVDVQVGAGGAVIITVDKGKQQGVAAGWDGVILSAGSGKPLKGGNFKIFKVTNTEAIGKVKLPYDTVNANRRVELTPPGGAAPAGGQ